MKGIKSQEEKLKKSSETKTLSKIVNETKRQRLDNLKIW